MLIDVRLWGVGCVLVRGGSVVCNCCWRGWFGMCLKGRIVFLGGGLVGWALRGDSCFSGASG